MRIFAASVLALCLAACDDPAEVSDGGEDAGAVDVSQDTGQDAYTPEAGDEDVGADAGSTDVTEAPDAAPVVDSGQDAARCDPEATELCDGRDQNCDGRADGAHDLAASDACLAASPYRSIIWRTPPKCTTPADWMDPPLADGTGGAYSVYARPTVPVCQGSTIQAGRMVLHCWDTAGRYVNCPTR